MPSSGPTWKRAARALVDDDRLGVQLAVQVAAGGLRHAVPAKVTWMPRRSKLATTEVPVATPLLLSRDLPTEIVCVTVPLPRVIALSLAASMKVIGTGRGAGDL